MDRDTCVVMSYYLMFVFDLIMRCLFTNYIFQVTFFFLLWIKTDFVHIQVRVK